MPASVICESACTITLDLALPPLQLDAADGAAIGGAILLVWAVGWAFRMLIRALNVDTVGPSDGSDS